ncbi:MAG: hypothetical protein HY898_20405 [Deltaproteobacteria bacterium]|nr:hypothetical protein [Deltaproteobacteria bacterium]
MSIEAPPCTPVSRAPSEQEVARDRWETVRGCFTIELDGQPPCEWACLTHKGGPCGNAGTYDMLVVMASKGERYERAGTTALADYGPGALGFRRTMHVESAGGQITLVASLTVPSGGSKSVERYRMVDGELREILAGTPSPGR